MLLLQKTSTKITQSSEHGTPQPATMNMNPFGVLTGMGRGQTPRYNTFAMPNRNPYGLPPGVGPREPRYNPWQDSGIDYSRGYHGREAFGLYDFRDQDMDLMQQQLDDMVRFPLLERFWDPYQYQGFRGPADWYNEDRGELFGQIGSRFDGTNWGSAYEQYRRR